MDHDEEAGNREAEAAAAAREARSLARRVANEKYALVFWKVEPRSADVVLKSAVLPDDKFPAILPLQDRKVMWGEKAYEARILATGLKGQLLKLKVSRDGEILTEVGPETQVVTTRKKAIAVVESRAGQVRQGIIDELDQLVLVAAEVPPPVAVQDRNADDIAEVEAALKILPCRTPPPPEEDTNYVKLGPNVYAAKLDMHYILKRFRKNPVKMLRAILELLLTEELIKRRCISLSGRGTAKLPPDILKAALSYTSLNSKGKDFDVTKTVSNFLLRKRK